MLMANPRLNRLALGLYLVAAVGLTVAVSVPFLRKTDSQFDNVYLRAAQRMQAGQDIYPLEDGYLYPPLMAWLAIPLTWLSPQTARVIWLGINLAGLGYILRTAWKLSGGASVFRGNDGKEHLILWAGLLCALRYGLDCLQNQQTDIVVIALVLAGCRQLALTCCVSSRFSLPLAVGCLGLAAGMKCTPLLFAPYLVGRGRWAAGLGVGVLAVVLNLLPNLTASPPDGGLWFGEWIERYLSLLARSDHHPGVWGSAVTLNQSWSGAVYRWLATTWTWDTGGVRVVTVEPLLTPMAMKLVVYGSELAVIAIIVGIASGQGHCFVTASEEGICFMRASGQRGLPGEGAVARRADALRSDPSNDALRSGPSNDALRLDLLNENVRLVAIECAVVLTLMVLLSPMSSKPHFFVLLLPAWILARQAVRHRDCISGAILVLATLTGMLTIKDLAGPNLANLAMWYGGVTWSTILLLIGVVRLLWRGKAHSEQDTDSRRAARGPGAVQPIAVQLRQLPQPGTKALDIES
ncbi:MAG: DUF2029 domain-containing protein [Gemmatales bacterium]|nr:DUF2029 domain-containing protein [Gemmatales bacterium]MDW8387229.1 glycosyltransferase family 87 protein [Gemmatales bacterium]